MEGDDIEMWHYLPDTLWLHVFSYLTARELSMAREVCVRWSRLCLDEMLWKRLLYRDFHIDRSIDKPPDRTWSGEYCRLTDDVPLVLTEVLDYHSNQVLHVSFSHDGSTFATASKDGTVVVWDATRYPCQSKFSQDMTHYSWKYPHFSQFNPADTLLLVSGIHFGSLHNTSGEIAVFSLQLGFMLQCRVANKPIDTFGCWIGDNHLISSDLHWLAHHTSLSMLWINRASQEPESEHIPVINQLYRLYNTSASTVRSIMIANDKIRDRCRDERPVEDEYQLDPATNKTRDTLSIEYEPEYYTQSLYNDAETSSADYSEKAEGSSERELTSEPADFTSEESSECTDQDFIDRKLLIYTCGTKTFAPHKVCFKYIENVHFPKHLNPGPPIQERIAARQRQKEMEGEGPDWTDYESVKYMFDEPDRVIDLMGHIIGMALSPDHKFLYVNIRIWPHGWTFDNPLIAPPISKLLHMYVINLSTLEVVGSLKRPNKEFSAIGHFIFLDISDHLIGSGAEKKNAYIWDRHYGIALAMFRHDDVVNAVAFSPKQSHIFVSVSDDYSIRVWRSKREVRRLGLHTAFNSETVARAIHDGRPCQFCDIDVQP